jgi:hypothetical protein
MKLAILLFSLLTFSLVSPAQKLILSVGNVTSLTIKTGTIFSADSLVLTPGADLTLSSNNIQVSPVAVNIAPHPSINRVYYLSSQILFTGTIQVYYQPSELNGNTESTLKYTDSATSSVWISDPSSTVNTSLHDVLSNASAHSFIGATASGPVIILPLSLISFTGNWDRNSVELQWVVDQNGESVNFNVESCSDGSSWKQIGQVNGQDNNGVDAYSLQDANPSSNMMYYRIKLLEASGQYSYSYIVKLQKADAGNDVRLLVNGNGVTVYFTGAQPTGIRLINTLGQILYSDKISLRQYDLNGLFPGAYFLQYELNGQWATRPFVVR